MTTRRRFLQGLGATTAVPLLPAATKASEQKDAATDPMRAPQRAVHQQQPYYDFDGVGEKYAAPAGNQVTREYCESLSEEEFLRRHWFS